MDFPQKSSLTPVPRLVEIVGGEHPPLIASATNPAGQFVSPFDDTASSKAKILCHVAAAITLLAAAITLQL
jgi:hypothetical protein